MRSIILTVLALAATALTIPLSEDKTAQPLIKRAVSPDSSCGGTNKYTCQGSQYGNCCSQWGFWYVLVNNLNCR